MSLLEVSNVTVQYQDFTAVNNVSFAVEPGQVIALVGPNGCGKSSLLKAIAHVNNYEGTISVHGKPVGELSRKERVRAVAYAPQHAEMDVDLTVTEIVRLGVTAGRGLFGKAQSGDDDRVSHALGHVNMGAYAQARWSELSGGQRQRVSIARALGQAADLVLLDEPTNHLDIEHQVQLMSLLRHIARKHSAGILVVLHDLGLAARVADQVVVMSAGHKVAYGAVEEALCPENINAYFRVDGEICAHPTGTRALFVHDRALDGLVNQ